MKDLIIKGTRKFSGIEIPVVLGGFGEDKKCLSDKTIAEIHNMREPDVRRRITDNIKRFKDGVDFIDLKSRASDAQQLLTDIGYTQMQISKAEHIYILSERGYARLIKIMDTDLAWEIHDKLMDEYFEMREERDKGISINRTQLSPELQMFMQMGEAMANQELEQKRQAKEQERQAIELNEVKENQKTIALALDPNGDRNFRPWVNRSLSAIAESENYQYIGSREERYRAVRTESYERLSAKRPCRLNQRVINERDRAMEAGASQEKIKAINKISIIESDKDLKPVYESVIREMLVFYCVEVK
ncbi:ORF6N domain-containing protein [Lachnospiraceae bacterium 54-53]